MVILSILQSVHSKVLAICLFYYPSVVAHPIYLPLLFHHLLELHTLELYPPLPFMVQNLSVWLLHQDRLCSGLLLLLRTRLSLLSFSLQDCRRRGPSRSRSCSRPCSRHHRLNHPICTILRRRHPCCIVHDDWILWRHRWWGEKKVSWEKRREKLSAEDCVLQWILAVVVLFYVNDWTSDSLTNSNLGCFWLSLIYYCTDHSER